MQMLKVHQLELNGEVKFFTQDLIELKMRKWGKTKERKSASTYVLCNVEHGATN